MAELKPEERQLFIDTNFVVLSTTRRDGQPRSVLSWVDIDGDDILINGGRSREWITNLRCAPRLALAIFDRQEPYRRAPVQRTVSAVTSPREKNRGVSAQRHRQQTGGADRPPAEHRTLVRVRPTASSPAGPGERSFLRRVA